MNNTYHIIRDAVIQRKQIIADYNGYRREMCPHVIGTKNGKRHALFYQFAGGSSTGLAYDGSPDNWRCIEVDRLRNVTSRDGEWHTAPNHSRRQSCVDHIDAEVSV